MVWLVNIDNEVSIREITRLPKNKILVSGGSKEFDCMLDDIEVTASVVLKIK